MKGRIEENKEKVNFEPFDLVITVETKEDLIALWHRLNVGEEDINPEYGKEWNYKWSDGTWDTWDLLDNKIDELELNDEL